MNVLEIVGEAIRIHSLRRRAPTSAHVAELLERWGAAPT